MTKNDFINQLRNAKRNGATISRTQSAAWDLHQVRATKKITKSFKCLISLSDCDVRLADDLSCAEYPHRKNWITAQAGYYTHTVDIDNGRYTGCTYTHWTYRPILQSWGAITDKRLYARIDNNVYRIRAGLGYFWQRDDLGIKLVRVSDNADYHIMSDDIRHGFIHIRTQLLDNVDKRKNERKIKRESMRLLNNLNDVYVCPRDSQNSGNCLAGTISFANNHGLNVSNHTHIHANVLKRLVKTDVRVLPVILHAVERTAREMQSGVSLLSDH